VIEGFRLASIFCERYPNLRFGQVPDWLDIPFVERGMHADLGGLSLSWDNLFHLYNPPPAIVTANFDNGTSLTIYLGPDEAVHAVVKDAEGRVVKTKHDARRVPLPLVSVLPQVAPLERNEVILGDDYVRRNQSSYLSSSHFRNQLRISSDEDYDRFLDLVEESWTGIRIEEFQSGRYYSSAPLSLMVRDGDFVAEVSWMGHGLQMWLQTMWFVARTPSEASIILDEPDVYMHPDLQQRLIRFLRGRFRQIIIATHSTEILSQVEPENVLVIDRDRRRSQFTTDLPAVQRLVRDIGSAQNIALTRLWSARRLLLVEGKDLRFFRRFQQLATPDAAVPIDSVPTVQIGGWSGWPYAIGSRMFLTNAGGEEIITYCFLDSDYHTDEQVNARKQEAVEKDVQLHVWRRKEIENYLVIPRLIHRVIVSRTPREIDPPSLENVEAQIDVVCNNLRQDTIDNFAHEFHNDNRAHGVQRANKKARDHVEATWATREGRISIVSGKELISSLSNWAKLKYHASFGISALIAEIGADELDREVLDVMHAFETGSSLP
jgi:hypothetical protein